MVTVPRTRPAEYFLGSTSIGDKEDTCLGAKVLVDVDSDIHSPVVSGTFVVEK